MINKDLIKKAKFLATEGVNDTLEITCNPDNWRYYIPLNPENADYQEYLEWAKTNTTEAAD